MPNEKLNRRDKLALEIEQKQALLKDLDARERTKQRKRDTRRKIIVGNIVLEQIEKDSELKTVIDHLLHTYIISKSDRELFELSLIESHIRPQD